MRRRRLALALALALPQLVLATEWQVSRYPSSGRTLVEVRHRPEDRHQVDKVVRLVEHARARFSALADTNLATTIRVVAAGSRRQYEEITEGMLPEWSSAAAIPAERTIFVALDSYGKPLEFTIPHEVSHVLLGQIARYIVPRWFDEGLAMYVAGEWTTHDSFLLARGAIFEGLIPLTEIDDVLGFNKDLAWLAYVQSFAAVKWLEQTWGESGVRILIRSTEHMHFDRAMQVATDLNAAEFEKLWYERNRRGYALTALADDMWIWTILIPALFAVALVVRWYKNRRTMERWRREDPWHDDDDDDDEPDEPLDERIANTY